MTVGREASPGQSHLRKVPLPGPARGLCGSFFRKHLTRRTRRTTEQHGEVFPARHAAANTPGIIQSLNSVPKHAAPSGKAPCCSVDLRVLRVRCLQQSAARRPCGHRRWPSVILSSTQMQLPWRRRKAPHASLVNGQVTVSASAPKPIDRAHGAVPRPAPLCLTMADIAGLTRLLPA